MSMIGEDVGGPDNTGGILVEQLQVARYVTVAGSPGYTISVPGPSSDQHIQHIHAPGLVTGLPAMVFFRTRHTRGTSFSLRLNSSSLFHHIAAEEGDTTWHVVIAPGQLKPTNNELVLSISMVGEVRFSDILILYTSDQLTVSKVYRPI